jgi:hypothetical protein
MVEDPVLKWLLAEPGFPLACAEAALLVPVMRHATAAKTRIFSNMIMLLVCVVNARWRRLFFKEAVLF